MSAYLARLKRIDADNFINSPHKEVTKPTKEPFGTFDTSHKGHIVNNHSDKNAISNWWLLHFADLDPVQVAIWPPCNHADVLALNPQAIAAEPLPMQVLDVANDCPIDQCEGFNQTLNDVIES
jgi:hypothetical protein